MQQQSTTKIPPKMSEAAAAARRLRVFATDTLPEKLPAGTRVRLCANGCAEPAGRNDDAIGEVKERPTGRKVAVTLRAPYEERKATGPTLPGERSNDGATAITQAGDVGDSVLVVPDPSRAPGSAQ